MILFYGYIFYYFAALIGISIGYHRYFTHRSFKTSSIKEVLMLSLGLLCGGRSALTWAAVHRMHHAKSDTADDPHSPMYKGWFNVLFSKWSVDYIPKKYIIDLIKNPRVIWFHKYGAYLHILFAIVIMTVDLKLFMVFVVIPFFLSYIGFGMLNYFAHKKGEPTNIPLLNIIAPGEGWHKNHHDKPMNSKIHKYDIAGIFIERFFITTKSSS